MTRLSVAIVSFNTKDELKACLDSVFASEGLESLEVLVADNASTDGSPEMVAARFPEAELAALDENVGFSRANNVLWRRSKGELVLFLNGDTRVPRDALATLVSLMGARPEVGALGPLLRDEHGRLEQSHGRMLSFAAELRQKILNWGYRGGDGPLSRVVEQSYEDERRVDWVSGACLVTRRSVLESVGGLDEEFFLYSEDVDLCARIRQAGHAVVFSPRTAITHLRGRSMDRAPDRAWVESQRSRLYFYQKHYGQPRVSLLKLYLAGQALAGYVLRPSGRGAYRHVLKLLWPRTTAASPTGPP